jgi:hypothetical protein
MPSTQLAKTGKKVAIPFLLVDEVEGGKITRAWMFEQGLAYAFQLGLVPAP